MRNLLEITLHCCWLNTFFFWCCKWISFSRQIIGRWSDSKLWQTNPSALFANFVMAFAWELSWAKAKNIDKNLLKVQIKNMIDVKIVEWGELRGSSQRKWSKLSNFCFLLKKCLQAWGHYVPIFRGLAALEPPQNWGQRGKKGGRFIIFFCFQ